MTAEPDKARERGSIILASLIVLVVAGAVSAGVAALVAATSETSADRFESEASFYAAESARVILQGGNAEALGEEPIQLGDRGYFRRITNSSRCEEGLELIVGWYGDEEMAEARGVHTICAASFGRLTQEDCEDPSEVDWKDPPTCVDGELWGDSPSPNELPPPGQLGPGVIVFGDLYLRGGGQANNFEESVCVLGDLRDGSPGGGQPPTVTFNETSCVGGEVRDGIIVEGELDAECMLDELDNLRSYCPGATGGQWDYEQ